MSKQSSILSTHVNYNHISIIKCIPNQKKSERIRHVNITHLFITEALVLAMIYCKFKKK